MRLIVSLTSSSKRVCVLVILQSSSYITAGHEYLVEQVQKLSPELQNLVSGIGPIGVFARRLMFVRHYAQFHYHRSHQVLSEAADDLVTMFREDIAPKAWWGVLFIDALELLQYSKFIVPGATHILTAFPDAAMLFTSGDAVELLFRLQEIDTAVSQGAGEDYLTVLIRIHKLKGEKEALARLRPVRLALARYMGRCAILGVGGRDTTVLAPRAGMVY
jgi:nuclear pore complex protein Nup85